MFRGTTIEELINSVCRAEEHARQEQRQAYAIPAIWEQAAATAGIGEGGLQWQPGQ